VEVSIEHSTTKRESFFPRQKATKIYVARRQRCNAEWRHRERANAVTLSGDIWKETLVALNNSGGRCRAAERDRPCSHRAKAGRNGLLAFQSRSQPSSSHRAIGCSKLVSVPYLLGLRLSVARLGESVSRVGETELAAGSVPQKPREYSLQRGRCPRSRDIQLAAGSVPQKPREYSWHRGWCPRSRDNTVGSGVGVPAVMVTDLFWWFVFRWRESVEI
jgi:hypothetical protein